MAKPKTTTVYGNHAVMAVIEHQRRPILELIVTPDNKATYAHLMPKGVGVRQMDRRDFDNKFKNQVHQGVALRVGELEQPDLEDLLLEGAELFLMLDQVTDPHNLGAILRSADAFGCDAVLVPSHNSAPITEVTAKAASGALETIPVINVGNLNKAIDKLKKAEFWCAGLTGYAQQELSEVDLKGKMVIIMGSEGKGMRELVEKNCDFVAKLPMVGNVESLNVSVATGITLYEAQKQRRKK